MNKNYYTKLPEMWRQVLVESRPATAADLKLAWWLLAEARFRSRVKVTNKVAAKMGLSRQTKWRSLNRLAEWGLIRIEKQKGKSPIVLIKWLAGRQPVSTG